MHIQAASCIRQTNPLSKSATNSQQIVQVESGLDYNLDVFRKCLKRTHTHTLGFRLTELHFRRSYSRSDLVPQKRTSGKNWSRFLQAGRHSCHPSNSVQSVAARKRLKHSCLCDCRPPVDLICISCNIYIKWHIPTQSYCLLCVSVLLRNTCICHAIN